jgi:hypothetical protein
MNMLPIFGGAIGGALYAGLKSGEASPVWGAAPPSSGFSRPTGTSPIKRIVGVVLLLGGGLLLVLAGVQFCETWTIAHREPRVATAADLCRKEYTDAPPVWISYTFAESKPTDLIVTRRRLGHGWEAQARCLLVRVEDKWLMATVALGFDGNNLVGQVRPLEPTLSQSVIERVRKVEPNRSALLPYEFNAVDGSASDQQERYETASVVAVFGLLVAGLGLYLFRRGRRPAQSNAETAIPGWTYHPLPNA